MGSCDSRAIANLMLDEAERNGFAISHLALQKLLYFAHGLYLVERKLPLVAGYFEAWEHGPVHPGAYQAFKAGGNRPISFRAMRKDMATGGLTQISPPDIPEVRAHVARIVAQYGGLSPGMLVRISHAKGAPWHAVTSRPGVALGVRITDDVISSCFRHHKISVGAASTNGDPGEDTPPA